MSHRFKHPDHQGQEKAEGAHLRLCLGWAMRAADEIEKPTPGRYRLVTVLWWLLFLLASTEAIGSFIFELWLHASIWTIAALIVCPPFFRRRPGWMPAAIRLVALAGLATASVALSEPASSNDSADTYKKANGTEPQVPPQSTKPMQNWWYAQSYDGMRKASTTKATVDGDEILEFAAPYEGGSKLTLTIRQQPSDGLTAYLTVTKGQIICPHPNREIAISLDRGPIQHLKCQEPGDGSRDTLFLLPASRVLNLIRKAQKLTVEAEYFHEGARQTDFDVSGLIWPCTAASNGDCTQLSSR